MDISTEWVLVLQQSVVIGILSDVASLSRFLIVLILGHKFCRVPSDLLSRSLLPLGTLAWDALRGADTFLHRLHLENSVNSRRVVRHATVGGLARGPVEGLEVSGVARVGMGWLLSNEFNYNPV